MDQFGKSINSDQSSNCQAAEAAVWFCSPACNLDRFPQVSSFCRAHGTWCGFLFTDIKQRKSVKVYTIDDLLLSPPGLRWLRPVPLGPCFP